MPSTYLKRELRQDAIVYLTAVFLFFVHTSISPAAEPPLETAEARLEMVQQERILDAMIEAVHQATVSAQTSGRVNKIYYDVDDYAQKGEVLLRMRDKEQKARFNAAEASYKEAGAEFKRVKDIYAKKLVAKAALDKAEARLKATQADLDQARENLENTVVRAPYSGIVVKRHIEVGETARLGQPLFTGLSLESLRASVRVPQDLINIVRQQQRARAILGLDEAASVAAESLTISPYADPETHTFLVRVNLPQGAHGVYPGMAVKVAFVTREVKKLVVPSRSVARRSEVSAVYVLDAENRVSLRQVRVGRRVNDGQVEILAGLSEGERVAMDPVRAAAYFKEQNTGKAQ